LNEHFDVIVIGSGPGGASLAQALAPTGSRILILERGDYLPREQANWSAKAVFVEGKYQAAETWIDANGGTFSPQLHYFVGGNSKVYGFALFRLRERHFDEVVHAGRVSPAWPLKYKDLAPYYDDAEVLFHLHGAHGEDPTEPTTTTSYPYANVLSLRCGETRAKRCGIVVEVKQHRFEAISSPARNFARPKGRRFCNADKRVHSLRRLRRIPLFVERDGGRTGGVRRSHAGQTR
jgi:choline dehydrogenase-like flavoprotein